MKLDKKIKNKNYLIWSVLLIIMGLSVFAQEVAYVFDDNSNINLTIPCYNSSNAFCDDSTNCYITIRFPDSSFLANNESMSRGYATYNYTIPRENIKRNYGEYHVDVYCVGSTDYGNTGFIMEVNPDSQRDDNYLILIIVGLFIYSLLIFSLVKQEYALGMVAAMGIIVIGIYVYMSGMAGIKNWITDTFALINIAIGAYIFLRGTTEEAMGHLGG